MEKKRPNKQKNSTENNELENILGAILAPVSPRGEFVHQLQHQLESRFDPKPLLVIPSKIWNFIVILLVGLFSGIFLTALGIKWIKKIIKSKKLIWQSNRKINEQTDQQVI